MNDTESKPSVLIVDDELNILKSIIRNLRHQGYHVTAVNTAERALQKMDSRSFDVVISDLRLPGMNGIEFLTLVTELFPDTAQIMLSGHAELADLRSAINQCRIDHFMSKPWDAQELRNVTRMLASGEREETSWAIY